MKTLYLYDSSKYKIKIDGPSLLVNKDAKAPRRIPYPYLDFVYIDYKEKVNPQVIKDFLKFKKPAVISSLDKNDSLHLIPISESGYFNEIPQRIAVKNEKVRKEVHMWMLEKKNQLQIIAIKSFDKNLSKALREHGFKNDEYYYYIMKFANNERYKYFNTRRKFTDLFSGLINAKCIEFEINPEIGVINDKKKLGFVYDILMVIDPVLDVLSAKMLNSKNYQLLYDGNWLNDKGFKTVVMLFEKGKPIFEKLIEKFIRKINSIINGKK